MKLMKILENQELVLDNVLSFTQQQMQEEMMKVGEVLQNLGVKK